VRTLQQLQDEAVAFAAERFPGQSTEGVICHLCREVRELQADPADHMEMADILLLLLQVADRGRVSAQALIENAFTKLEINRRRTWGTPDAEGVVQHVGDGTEGSRWGGWQMADGKWQSSAAGANNERSDV
jgi:hypothetical protein